MNKMASRSKTFGAGLGRFSRRGMLKASTAAVGAISLLPVRSYAQVAGEQSLQDAFKTPPNAARPRVWWHWINGNVSKAGIDADFAWMERVGIGGVQNFDAALGRVQIVDDPAPYRSPAWQDRMLHAVNLADEKGLEFTIAGSPGWSQTGGPWVRPEQSTKKLVWSETVMSAGERRTEPLPMPPTVVGPYGAMESGHNDHFEIDGEPFVSFYRDQHVIAFPIKHDVELLNDRAKITSSIGAIDGALLTDGNFRAGVKMPYDRLQDKSVWIEFAFDKPQTIRALTLYMSGGTSHHGQSEPSVGWVEVADGDGDFERIANLPGTNIIPRTIALPERRATRVRVQIAVDPEGRKWGGFDKIGDYRTEHEVYLLELSGKPTINYAEDKAAFWDEPNVHTLKPVPLDPAVVIDPASVIEITDKMRPDGTLDWQAPEGRWLVMRMGYGLTGETNGPAADDATGLEVDKLNKDHVRKYITDYLSFYEEALGPDLIGEQGLSHLLTDSYEAGATNWTDGMRGRFSSRRGYDPTTYFPALAGYVVGNAEASDRFLWDWRATIGDLIADEHYGEITDYLHERGMRRYGEGHEDRRAIVADGMQVKKSADIPMGSTWMPDSDFLHATPGMRDADIRESASVAHIYGQNLTAAESMTTGATGGVAYHYAPRHLKPVADRMMSSGLNRIVVHTSVHQPTFGPGPGLGLSRFGQWFTRRETWAEQAGAWVDYLSRSCHLLQQGRFNADIGYFYGQDDNITMMFQFRAPEVPEGYAYDFVNGDALVNTLFAENGRVTSPAGVAYRAIAIDSSVTRVTLPVLRKLAQFLDAGIPVIGPKPASTPSLADDHAEFAALAARMWDHGGAIDSTLEEVLPTMFEPAFSWSSNVPDAEIRFVHRVLEDGELFQVISQTDAAQDVELSFRVAGKDPEIWCAKTGRIEPAPFRSANGRTIIARALVPNDAVFVVFRKDAAVQQRAAASKTQQLLAHLDDGWHVEFPLPFAGPKHLSPAELTSWTEHSDPDIKYFSGVATYHNAFMLEQRPSGRLSLELGDVREIAEVLVNGKTAGVVWTYPFAIDVTDFAKPGKNTVEIRVANLWVNRLIGDKAEQPAQTVEAIYNPYDENSALLPSGLMGPVRLIREYVS